MVHVPEMFVITYYFEPTVDIRDPIVFTCSTGLKLIPTSVRAGCNGGGSVNGKTGYPPGIWLGVKI